MRIFFICQRVPFPPDRGDKITTFNELRYLAREHDVHVFCLADGKADLANVPGVQRLAREVTAVPLDGRRSRLRAMGALLGGGSISVAMFREAALHAAIRQAYDRLRPDLIFVYSSNVAQYAEPFAGTPRIMQFADLDSLKFEGYAASLRAPLRWICAIEARRLLAYERQIASAFSHSLVCTGNELGDFQRLIPGRPASVVGNGVDIEVFRPGEHAKRSGGIIFTGVMDYIPNVDAVVWFCEEVLPLVQRQVPQAHFTICGSRPSPAVQRLAQHPGVTVTGWVEDIRPHLDRAEVFVAPLRVARGIQNKILEGMAMRLPVVTSTTAWAATGLPAGEGILAADDPAAIAGHVVRLLKDRAFRMAMSEQARLAVERAFSWERQFAELQKVIQAVSAGQGPCGEQRRQRASDGGAA